LKILLEPSTPWKFRIQKLLIRLYLRYFSFVIYLAARFILLFSQPGVPRPKSLLVLKPDAIGDYILMRNFLIFLRKSDCFAGYHITWCGNSLQKDLVEQFDKGIADEYIWIDKNRVYHNFFHYLQIARNIYHRFEVCVHPVFSRELLFDFFARIAGTKERIGCVGDTININHSYLRMSDKWYTTLIPSEPSCIFEFEKNRRFFGQLLETDIPVTRPYIDRALVTGVSILSLPPVYAVIFPGAQMSYRRWPVGRFAEVADFIAGELGLTVVIAGSRHDSRLAAGISLSARIRPHDITGKTNFTELISVISGAALLVSNDTSAVHIAASLAVPVVALSQLNHYGRFIPYPDYMEIPLKCVIPGPYQRYTFEELAAMFRDGSMVSIDLIETNSVIESINDLMHTSVV